MIDFDEQDYQRYLQECRAISEDTNTVIIPSIKDYMVWRSEQELDDYEVEDNYER